MTGNPTNCTGNSKIGGSSCACTALSLKSIMANISADNSARDGQITWSRIFVDYFDELNKTNHEIATEWEEKKIQIKFFPFIYWFIYFIILFKFKSKIVIKPTERSRLILGSEKKRSNVILSICERIIHTLLCHCCGAFDKNAFDKVNYGWFENVNRLCDEK